MVTMTKAQLIRALDRYPDNTEIFLGTDVDNGSGPERVSWNIGELEYTENIDGESGEPVEPALVIRASNE